MNKLKNPNEKIVGQHYAQYVATQDECNKKCINDDNCASYNLELNQSFFTYPINIGYTKIIY